MSQQGSFVSGEIAFQRRQTAMWIQTEGRMISLIRPSARVRTGAGGYASIGATQTLPPKLRIRSTQAREQFFQGGDVGVGPRVKQYLLGTYDDDIQQGDSFVDPVDGHTYTVEYVHEDRSVETKAELTELPG